MKNKEKIRESSFSKEKKERLQCYFSLLTQEDNVVWIDAVGYSMLPLFWPGCRLRLNTSLDSLELGHVVVFPGGKKLIAHRIVGRDAETKRWIAKGDTLYFFDQPVDEDEIFGVVDFVDQRGKHLWVGTDSAVARLSARLGRRLEDSLNWLPVVAKKIYYYTLFFPGFLAIQLKKKF